MIGLGTQIVEISRVQRLLERHAERFVPRVFVPEEQQFVRARTRSLEHYAALWAAKEAVLRSVGATWKRGILWTDVVLLLDQAPECGACLRGNLQILATRRSVTAWRVAFAYTRHYATATAIALRAS
jgi:holo-[acyl-carrier protein] synthase